MKKRPFLLLSGAFVFGEVCCYGSLTAAVVALFILTGATAAVWAGILPPGLLGGVCRRIGGARGRFWPLLVPALFLVGMLRMADASEWSGIAAGTMETEGQLKVRAVVRVDEIRRTDSSLQFYTRTILEIREQDSDASIPGDNKKDNEKVNGLEDSARLYGAAVTLKGDEEAAENIKIGDVISGEGTFTLFDAATNFGQFDPRQYYKARGLEGRLKLEKWISVSYSRFSLTDAGMNLVYRGKQFLLGRLYKAMGVAMNGGTREKSGARAGETSEKYTGKEVREVSERTDGKNIAESAERDAGLLGAILTGEKRGISDEDQKLFQESGISHMYAVSGLHASFFGWGLYGILKKLGASRKVCSAGAGIGLWMLVIAAGGSVSVKRAFCMFLLSLLAGLAGRTYDLPISLSAACMLILWERPLMLFQSGFQLSFCAVLGIVAAAGVMDRNNHRENVCFGEMDFGKTGVRNIKKDKAGFCERGFKGGFSKRQEDGNGIKWEERKERFRKGLTASLWIQLALLPSTLWNFFQYPCYGIFLNLVVIPMLSVVLALGFFAMALSCVWVTGAGYCLLPVRGIFWFWRLLCEKARGLPGALWLTGKPKTFVLVIFCILLLGFWVGSFRKKWGSRSWYPGCLALLLPLSLAFLTRRPDAGLQITFLDVGQGDSIYAREESGYTMMIDGGSSDGWKVGENRILPMIKASGSRQVDDWFLSHPDQDHLSGLKEILLIGFPIERLWVPEVFREDEAVLELLELAKENGTEARFTRPGVLVSDDGKEADSFSITCLYPEPDEPISSANDGSMVLLARYDGVNILFTGDLESSGEARLLARGGQSGQLSCDILKVGHHGSKGSTSQAFLTELDPFFAVISCGKGNSYGHPHPELLNRLDEQRCQVVSTMDGGAVTLKICKGRIYSREQRAK